VREASSLVAGQTNIAERNLLHPVEPSAFNFDDMAGEFVCAI
jgi:hypothetical protein